MISRPKQHAEHGLDALAEAGLALGLALNLSEALQTVADGAARAVLADVVVARVLDDTGARLNAVAVATPSPAVAAELEGSRLPLADVPQFETSQHDELPAPLRRIAERVHAPHVMMLPVHVGGELRGTLEVMRSGQPFDAEEKRLARLAGAQAALAIRAFAADGAAGRALDSSAALSLAGDALAAGADETKTAEQVARLAVEATHAHTALLWRQTAPDPALELVASFTESGRSAPAVTARGDAEQALRERESVVVASDGRSATLQLGQPPLGALQLLYDADAAPTRDDLACLATFGVRAAHALRASRRTQTLALELERTRALLAVVGQAISQLSLAHTLETAVARVAELLDVDRLAVYLHEEDRLYAAAGLGLAGPHVRLAEKLLELTLGPFRSRGVLFVRDVRSDARLAGVGDTAAEAGIEAAIGVPLLVRDEVVGLLGVFPSSGRELSESQSALLASLASQLAVAVQNAQLHERAKRLSDEREHALDAEKAASKQVGALYEISRSFAQSLSLEATLKAVASTVVEVLDVDAAVIRMPDERREWLLPRALRVADPNLDEAARAIIFRPEPFGAHAIQRLFRHGEPLRLTPQTVEEIGGDATALTPFLERGWTGAMIPIATPAEVLAALTVLSMRPDLPVTQETIAQATAIAGQAALAVDNARLYQQQKEFADTMQRSLLPRGVPELEGLELGAAYESSARVEVGGDVYDFLELDDGRLAVALGDVTGHGIEAAADMAMAKFVFRSLAREHSEPSDFLQAANDIVVGEIAPGKFITMIYLVIAPGGSLAAAGGGHPPPRLIAADGTVTGLAAEGLVLGIEPDQQYDEVRAQLDAGGAVVLYTDGVLEARRDGELYGFERLDRILSEQRDRPAGSLAQAVLDDCRSFALGELVDDCAVVVIKRLQ